MDIQTTGIVLAALLFVAMVVFRPSKRKRKTPAFVLTFPLLAGVVLVYAVTGQDGAVFAGALGAVYVFANFALG